MTTNHKVGSLSPRRILFCLQKFYRLTKKGLIYEKELYCIYAPVFVFLITACLSFPIQASDDDDDDVEPTEVVVTGKKLEKAILKGDYYNIGRHKGRLQYLNWLTRQSQTNLPSGDEEEHPPETENPDLTCKTIELKKSIVKIRPKLPMRNGCQLVDGIF
ncbi:hypothetical protein [Marinimicrobium sp. C2-29]|uniref:hypothetical protein n=1 Tax=Marinimicrobium sp. C2-29 TaxID=3139825 RepID=UPI003139FE58